MSDLDYLNLSTDLRRIALWLQEGRLGLADKFIAANLRRFSGDKEQVGKRKIGEWLMGVGEYKKARLKAAEDALTLSVLLKNRFSPVGL